MDAPPDKIDKGRVAALKDLKDDDPEKVKWTGAFKTPTLRNITITAPYMHNGFFDNLRDAVAFYATRDTQPARWFPEGKKFDDLPAQYHANVDVDTPPYQRRPLPAEKSARVETGRGPPAVPCSTRRTV